jgi:hypothetical protein
MAKKVYKTPRYYYSGHKAHAKARGIEFNMTFAEWWATWTDSGRWIERGIRRGCYVMARHGDQGAYEVGNVSIVLHEVNSVESHLGKPLSAEWRAKIAAVHRGRVFTPETLAKMSAGQKARYSDPEQRRQTSERSQAQFADPEARRRASEKQLAYLARRATLA